MLTVDKLTIAISIVGQIIIPIFLKFCVKPRQTVSDATTSNQFNNCNKVKDSVVNNCNINNNIIGDNVIYNKIGSINHNIITINNPPPASHDVDNTSANDGMSIIVAIVILAIVFSVPLFSKYHSAFLLIMSFLFSIFISQQNTSFKIRRKYMVFITSCYLFSYFCFVHPLFIASSYSTFVDSSILYILKKPTLAKVRNYLGVLSQLLSTVMWCSYFASSIVCEIKRKPTLQSDRLSFNSDKISDKVILISILLLASVLMVPYLAIFCFDATF